MASAAVRSAVEARLAANWAHTPIRAPNPSLAGVPADGSAFVSVQYPLANEEQMTIGAPGANIWRETGAFRVVLAVPAATDLAVALWPARLDALRAAFRGKVFDGVRTYEASPPIVDGATDDGAYALLSFAVVYDHDITG